VGSYGDTKKGFRKKMGGPTGGKKKVKDGKPNFYSHKDDENFKGRSRVRRNQ